MWRQFGRLWVEGVKPIPEWLEAVGLSAKAVKNHVSNVDLFTEYLVYYEPLKRLAAADTDDFYDFPVNWFPRKVT